MLINFLQQHTLIILLPNDLGVLPYITRVVFNETRQLAQCNTAPDIHHLQDFVMCFQFSWIKQKRILLFLFICLFVFTHFFTPGLTCLHVATLHKQHRIMKLLIKKGVDLNLQVRRETSFYILLCLEVSVKNLKLSYAMHYLFASHCWRSGVAVAVSKQCGSS